MNGHIVAGVDGSAPATAAVEWAAADAQRRGAALRVVHVCEPRVHDVHVSEPRVHDVQVSEPRVHDESAASCAGVLEAAVRRARELTRDVEVSGDLLGGDVVRALLAESHSADSVVLGSRGRGGFAGMLLGSVGLAVAGHATGPVVIVRAPTPLWYDRVVAGYDGSEHAEVALDYAVEQARARGSQLHVVYAWQLPAFSAYAAPYAVPYGGLLEDLMAEQFHRVAERIAGRRERDPGLVITDEQVCAHPITALVEAGRTADLVVVGSRGLGGLASAVLGSVGHGVLHHVTCPVAVVRPHVEEPPEP
ncbi:universal stress protein [Nonomuraea sp. NPDC048882]|uniref:universal stress protein n=1 Tax=Nonomuraea sp. NPDC048882 TaxID=3154347 RepID=UPI0033E3983E